jgi:hypothetical protein
MKEAGGTCSRYGGKTEIYKGFWLENLKERVQLEDLKTGGNTRKSIFKNRLQERGLDSSG